MCFIYWKHGLVTSGQTWICLFNNWHCCWVWLNKCSNFNCWYIHDGNSCNKLFCIFNVSCVFDWDDGSYVIVVLKILDISCIDKLFIISAHGLIIPCNIIESWIQMVLTDWIWSILNASLFEIKKNACNWPLQHMCTAFFLWFVLSLFWVMLIWNVLLKGNVIVTGYLGWVYVFSALFGTYSQYRSQWQKMLRIHFAYSLSIRLQMLRTDHVSIFDWKTCALSRSQQSSSASVLVKLSLSFNSQCWLPSLYFCLSLLLDMSSKSRRLTQHTTGPAVRDGTSYPDVL